MKLKFVYFFLFLLIFSNCKDPFNFKSAGNVHRLTIDARISDGPGPYQLNLGKTSLPDRLPDPVTGASITLYDNAGHKENYIDKGKGKYDDKNTKITSFNITQTIVHDYDKSKYNKEWNEKAIKDRWFWFLDEVSEILQIDTSILKKGIPKFN